MLKVGLFVICFFTGACGNLVSHERPQTFFTPFVNSSDAMTNPSEKMAQVKFLEVNDVYPMRLVLSEDGRVYYQIDRLGDGYGTWSYSKGALVINASRTLFDMILYVSGKEEAGDAMVVKFYDRFGSNTLDIRARNTGNAPDVNENGLKLFTSSSKGI